ncbi:hypothetical protein HPB50_022165 [Hyalomma asiaticum]|uniref:Uncharacterized protein n=1 Tax=Hyalomma asiaticum TaxID=266040 RepID=A0ACB7RX31_HYAAI|nr:hypothetical protein HPB50_022165 [Hyalomma asiaticum]
MGGRGNSGVGIMLIRCLFITQFAGYLAAYVFGTATAHAPDVMQCVAWSSFPRRVMEVTDSARRRFSPSILRPSPSTTTWSTTIKASPVDSFISGRGNSGVGIMLIRCLFITQFAGYLAAYVFGTATAHAPDVMQCVAWSSFPRRVMEVTDSARVGCPIFLADNSDGFPFASSTLTLDPALDKTNVTLDGPITDRHSSTTTWSTTIKASPVDSFISGRGNSGVGIMLIRCLFITQLQPFT